MSDRHLDPTDEPRVPMCCGEPMVEDSEMNLNCKKCGLFWPAFDFNDAPMELPQ